MSTFGNILVSTLVQGSLYAILGAGIVVLFRSTGVVSFAQGAFVVVGAYVFYYLNARVGVPFYAALLLALLSMFVIGSLIYLLMFRRLTGAETFVLVIATLGLNVVIQTVVILSAGVNLITPPEVLSLATLGVWHGLGIAPYQIFTIVAAGTLLIVLQLILSRKRLGSQMRSVADNTLLAALMKVHVHRMSALAWGIAATCAGLAGVCLSLQTPLDPIGLQDIGLVVLAGVMLGGIDSVTGALAGGLLLALVQQLSITWFGGQWSDPVSYLVLLGVLLVRPQGLYGSKGIVRL